MFELVALVYEFAASFIPFALAVLILKQQKGKYSIVFTQRHYVLHMIFALYIMAVFHVTGAGTIYEAIEWRNVPMEYRMEKLNLIPFSREIDLIGYVLNIVMLIPFGFLVPLIWEKMGRLSRIVPAGFLFSLLIELSQLLNVRGTDVDDLIMNTLGAIVGFVIYLSFDRVTHSKYQFRGVNAMALPVLVVAMYLGRCLLFNYLGWIQLWYGY